MKMRMVLLACVAVCASGEARADYTSIGQGSSSCGTWAEYRRSGGAVRQEQWILGFLSGVGWVNLNGDDPLKGLDAPAVFAWIDNYCRANPLHHVNKAAGSLAIEHPR